MHLKTGICMRSGRRLFGLVFFPQAGRRHACSEELLSTFWVGPSWKARAV